MSPLLRFLSKLIKAPQGILGYLTVLFSVWWDYTCHFTPQFPLQEPRHCKLQHFWRKLFASIKWRDPVGKFLSYWLEVFVWIKKTTDMVGSPCSVCMCFKALTVVWTKARENFQFERNMVGRRLLVVSLCVWSELGPTEAPWQIKSSEKGLKFRFVALLYIFYFNLLCSPWEEEWWCSPERLFGPLGLGMV